MAFIVTAPVTNDPKKLGQNFITFDENLRLGQNGRAEKWAHWV